MAININASDAGNLMLGSYGQGHTSHDVVDFANAKMYRHVQVSESVVGGDAIGVSAKSRPGVAIEGISIGSPPGNNFRFILSFGKTVAKVATGTPANAFLTADEGNPGVLRAINLDNPERVFDLLKALDERHRYDAPWEISGDGAPPTRPRIIVSLTAESDGLADVFIC
jgi:hypothetical protein